VKSEAIDVLKIYAEWDTTRWNAWLTERAKLGDFAGLADTRRRLQMGMDNLVRQKLNTDKVGRTFLRMAGSIEKTMRQMLFRLYPNKSKKELDLALELYLRRTSF
jgi:hypothetical protein